MKRKIRNISASQSTVYFFLFCFALVSLRAFSQSVRSQSNLNEAINNLDSGLDKLDIETKFLDQELSPEEKRSIAKKLEKISTLLEEKADVLKDTSHYEKSKSKKRKYFLPFIDGCRDGEDQLVVDKNIHDKFYIAPSWKGPLSNNSGFWSQMGFEVGYSSEWLNGVDLGVGVGSLFQENGKLLYDVRSRVFLLEHQRSWYAGVGYVLSVKKSPYATLGWSGESFFFEADFIEGSSTPIKAIPQIGFRFRF